MWTKHKKVILAACGSVLIHALILLVLAILIALQGTPQAARPPEPIRLQIVHRDETPPPLVPVTPPPAPRKKNADTQDMAEVAEAQPDAQYQSDKNTAARSEAAPSGPEAGPAQNGRAIPAFMFDTHRYLASASADQPPAAPAATPVPETAPPLPQPNTAARPQATPAAAETPVPTPLPTAAPDEFALAEPTPTPKPPDFDPFVRNPDTAPPGPTPVMAANRPQRRALSDEEKTLIRGNLSTRGAASVAAAATPVGRYSKAVSDAIRLVWFARINNAMDVASFGTVKIHFSVDRRGKIVAPRVVSNSGNEALAAVSLEAIMDAAVPPIPPELVPTIEDTDLPLDFDFSLY